MTTTIWRIPARLAKWSAPPASKRVGGSAVPASLPSAARTMRAPAASCSACRPLYCSGLGCAASPLRAVYRKRSTAATSAAHPGGGGHADGADATSAAVAFNPVPSDSVSVTRGHVTAEGAAHTGGLNASCGGGGGSGTHASLAPPHATATGSDQEMSTSMTVPAAVTRRVGNAVLTLHTNGAPTTSRDAADRLPRAPSSPWGQTRQGEAKLA